MREIMNARIVILISEAMDDRRIGGKANFCFFCLGTCCAGIFVSFYIYIYICNQINLNDTFVDVYRAFKV